MRLPRKDILLEKKRKLHKQYEDNFKELRRTVGLPIEHRLKFLYRERKLQQRSVALVKEMAILGLRSVKVKGLVIFMD